MPPDLALPRLLALAEFFPDFVSDLIEAPPRLCERVTTLLLLAVIPPVTLLVAPVTDGVLLPPVADWVLVALPPVLLSAVAKAAAPVAAVSSAAPTAAAIAFRLFIEPVLAFLLWERVSVARRIYGHRVLPLDRCRKRALPA